MILILYSLMAISSNNCWGGRILLILVMKMKGGLITLSTLVLLFTSLGTFSSSSKLLCVNNDLFNQSIFGCLEVMFWSGLFRLLFLPPTTFYWPFSFSPGYCMGLYELLILCSDMCKLLSSRYILDILNCFA